MSTSPSFLKSVACLIAVVVFPILCLIWAAKCIVAKKSEWVWFLLFAFLGIVEIAIDVLHFTRPDVVSNTVVFATSIAYLVTWVFALFGKAEMMAETARQPA
ncbi:hypothetical protein KW799_02200 [Candidatus Parcubacteria bacterium]|nr:hypothetical protein [Candidatus Parcubacteria bacterium]